MTDKTNDNEFDPKQITSVLTDDQCLSVVQDIFQDRVMCGASFLQDKSSGLITHSIIVLKLDGDDEEVWSDPQELAVPLMMVAANDKDENGPTIN